MSNAAERGNIMHKMLELFLLEWAISKDVERSLKKAQIFAIEEARKDNGANAKLVERGRNLFWNFYNNRFWERISEVVENEIFLFTIFKGGWAGASDFVYRDLEGHLIVEDFKSSTSPKEEDDILSYKLQITAYMFMCAEKYKEVPKMGIIRISNEQNGDLQTFTVHDYEMKEYLKQFVSLVEEFRKINDL
jgi:RecB family exonuclease